MKIIEQFMTKIKNRSMFFYVLIRSTFTFMVITIIVALFLFIVGSNEKIIYAFLTTSPAEAFVERFENAQRYFEESYENDYYGSITPEGTLKLFVKSIENNDVLLASKYYVPDLWVKKWQQIDDAYYRDKYKHMLDYTNNNINYGKNKFYKDDDDGTEKAIRTYNYIENGVKKYNSFRFIRNKNNGIWKITDRY